MPFQTWSVGQEMLAAEFQTYIGDQIVATFADASQRDAQLPGPNVGQLCTLDSYPGAVWVWTGSTWAEVGGPFTQSGNSVVSTNAGGGGTIYYPVPFATGNNPIVLTNGDSATSDIRFAVIQAQNLTDAFGFTARWGDGSGVFEGDVRVHWIATGLRVAT